MAVWVSRTRDASVDFCSLISLGTVSDLLAAALQHGAAKRVVLVAVELTTYGSGRPPAYSSALWAPEQSHGRVCPAAQRRAPLSRRRQTCRFHRLSPSRRSVQRQMPTAARSIPRRDAAAEPAARTSARRCALLRRQAAQASCQPCWSYTSSQPYSFSEYFPPLVAPPSNFDERCNCMMNPLIKPEGLFQHTDKRKRSQDAT